MATPNALIVDLTHTLSTSTTPRTIYPGDPEFHVVPHATIANDGYSVHNLSLGTHTGTHIDAPCHFVEGGKSIDQIPLDELVGCACIVHLQGETLRSRQKIDWDDLEAAWKQSLSSDFSPLHESLESGKYKMLLVNTDWSRRVLQGAQFDPVQFFGHPYFSSSIATRLLSTGVRLFGTDVPNPDETPFDDVGGADGYAFHEVLLGGGGLIVENIANLHALAAETNDWIVNIVPLKLEGTDGSPVRAFAYPSGKY